MATPIATPMPNHSAIWPANTPSSTPSTAPNAIPKPSPFDLRFIFQLQAATLRFARLRLRSPRSRDSPFDSAQGRLGEMSLHEHETLLLHLDYGRLGRFVTDLTNFAQQL